MHVLCWAGGGGVWGVGCFCKHTELEWVIRSLSPCLSTRRSGLETRGPPAFALSGSLRLRCVSTDRLNSLEFHWSTKTRKASPRFPHPGKTKRRAQMIVHFGNGCVYKRKGEGSCNSLFRGINYSGLPCQAGMMWDRERTVDDGSEEKSDVDVFGTQRSADLTCWSLAVSGRAAGLYSRPGYNQ